jgi:hypothetical protein
MDPAEEEFRAGIANPTSTEAGVHAGELRFACPTCPQHLRLSLAQIDPVVGVVAFCPRCSRPCHVPGGFHAPTVPPGLQITGALKVPARQFVKWYQAHPVVIDLIRKRREDLLRYYGLWAFCFDCGHQYSATVLLLLTSVLRRGTVAFTPRSTEAALDYQSLAAGKCHLCGSAHLAAIVTSVPDHVLHTVERYLQQEAARGVS